jgi:hypothetical protein
MSTALWIGGAALVVLLVLFAAWRLRNAARTIEKILTEERERPVEPDQDDDLPATRQGGNGGPPAS